MKMSQMRRATHVLAYGIRRDDRLRWQSDLESGLQGMHAGWSITSSFAGDGEAAEIVVWERCDLEVVYMTNHPGFDRDRLAHDADIIAVALKGHAFRPWVLLDEGLEFLAPIFEKEGVEVRYGLPETVITERWETQVAHAPL